MSPQPVPLGIDPALMTQLINLMKRLSTTIPDMGAQVDRSLATVQLQLYGPGTARDIGRQIAGKVPDLQRRLDLMLAAQKVALDTSKALWADESKWLSDTPAAGAATAKRLADALRTGLKKGTIDAKTLAELQKHQEDPYFAVAFATQMPPHELKSLIAKLYRGQTTPAGADPEVMAQLDKLSAALGTILGTASRGAGGMKLPKGYVDELLKHLDIPETAFALNKLLRSGTYDDAFLLEIATKVYDYERKQPRQSPYWLNFTPTTQPANDLPAAYKDPMAAVAAALANNSRAAQDFFTDPKRKPLDYLMRERPWHEYTDTDLGNALEAATRTFRDHDQPPEQSRGYKSALIASWAMHFWGNPQVQNNLPHTRQNVGNIISAYMSDLHRASVDRVAHKPGVITRDPDTMLAGTQPYGAVFDRDGISGVMKWAFADTDVLKTVVTGHGQYSIEVLDERAARLAEQNRADFEKWHKAHPNATAAEIAAQRQKILEERMNGADGAVFSQAIERLSRTLFVITDAGNIAKIESADQHDKMFNAFKEAVTSVADLAPGPQGKIAGWLFDRAKSQVADQFTAGAGAAARSEAATTTGQTVDMFMDLTADAMMRHGLFGDGEVPARTHPHASVNYPRGSEGDFMDGDKIIPWSKMTAKQREAYTEWITSPDTGAVFRNPSNAVTEGFNQANDAGGQGG
ncbi:DUF6571 family protein [Nonomuraea fastidiosa]|uniref:DUF6571 family protein n=1 Tax=Nonomuraea TaxID=83681 RepID=UPI003423EA63